MFGVACNFLKLVSGVRSEGMQYAAVLTELKGPVKSRNKAETHRSTATRAMAYTLASRIISRINRISRIKGVTIQQ